MLMHSALIWSISNLASPRLHGSQARNTTLHSVGSVCLFYWFSLHFRRRQRRSCSRSQFKIDCFQLSAAVASETEAEEAERGGNLMKINPKRAHSTGTDERAIKYLRKINRRRRNFCAVINNFLPPPPGLWVLMTRFFWRWSINRESAEAATTANHKTR